MVHDFLASCIPFSYLLKFGGNCLGWRKAQIIDRVHAWICEYAWIWISSLCLMHHETCPNICTG